MMHPVIEQILVDQRVEALQRDGRQPVRPAAQETAEDLSRIELRLCSVNDDQELEELAALNETKMPHGRFVLARVNGRLVAALALCDGHFLADPFVRTAHIRRLLEVRARQIDPKTSGRLHLPWAPRRSFAG